MHVMVICEQFLTAHKKQPFGVTVDCYLSSSAKCSAVAKKADLTLEIRINKKMLVCILLYLGIQSHCDSILRRPRCDTEKGNEDGYRTRIASVGREIKPGKVEDSGRE